MVTPAIFLVLLLCALLGWLVSLRRRAWRDADMPWPFYAKKPLVSPEQVLYQRLVSALPGHLVLSRVPVSAVLGVRRSLDSEAWSQRIRALQYDFVVCRRDATVLAAIDLNDQSSSANEGTGPDWLKERASAAAGVRLLHWPAKSLPDQARIQAVFGAPLTQIFEERAPSANQSWWPPNSRTHADTPPN